MTDQYGLIGYPLSHSFSKKYFTEKFEKEKIGNAEYKAFPIENILMLPDLIQENPALKGLSVTIPYKESVIPFLDEMDETAKKVGAVNCIKISHNSHHSQLPTPDSGLLTPHLKGYNTDVFGFRQSIKPFLESQHERALILGTGGASKAVHFVLSEIGIDCHFVARDKSKVQSQKVFEYGDVNANMINAFKLIINATPLGMFPNVDACPPIPYEFISKSHLLFDLIYNPTETEFLKRGKAQGAAIVNGYSMLQQQAEEAWRIWTS